MLRVVSVDLGFHVVIGVGRLNVQQEGFIRQLHFTTHTQYQVQSSFLLDVVVRLCPVIVNSICIPYSCIFHIAKTGPLRCCLYSGCGFGCCCCVVVLVWLLCGFSTRPDGSEVQMYTRTQPDNQESNYGISCKIGTVKTPLTRR